MSISEAWYEMTDSFRDWRPADWRYFRLTVLWSVGVCEGINLIVAAFFLFVRPSGDIFNYAALHTTFMCQVFVVSSVLTGIWRRRRLERSKPLDFFEGLTSFGIAALTSCCLFLGGLVLYGLGLAFAGQASFGEILVIGFVLPYLVGYFFAGIFILSPVLVPAILASQAFMTRAAKQNSGAGHA
jgi:hypothetical protein